MQLEAIHFNIQLENNLFLSKILKPPEQSYVPPLPIFEWIV
jgi:hypothetical protein